MTVHLRKVCGCGHEEAWHGPNRGPCTYGHATAHGGCTCDRFHRRSRAATSAPVEEPDVACGPFVEAIDEIIRVLVRLRTAIANGTLTSSRPLPPLLNIQRTKAGRVAWPAPEPTPSSRPKSRADGELGQLPHALLSVLAQRSPRPTSRDQLAILAKYSSRSGSFAAGLARLRAKEFICDGHPIHITNAGLTRIGPTEPLPSGKELLAYWVGALSLVEGTLLQAIADARPDILSREALANVSRYSARSGSFAAALAKLRTLELIERRELRLSSAFDDATESAHQ